MSFTANTPSTETIPDEFQLVQSGNPVEYISYGAGGIQDPSKGLRYQKWYGSVARGRDGAIISLVPEKDGETITILSKDFPVSQFSFTFDQNMTPAYAYMACGVSKYYWFNNVTGQFQLDVLENAYSPFVVTDELRQFNIGQSDIILAYVKDNIDSTSDLCFRLQRDRYTTEYILAYNVGAKKIVNIGMNTQLRFQFELADREDYVGPSPTCESTSK